jgi:hypothetical protein
MEKLCLFCVYFDYEAIGYTYYSTLTGGQENGGMSCRKNHYSDSRPDDAKTFREIILTAENCDDYHQVKK